MSAPSSAAPSSSSSSTPSGQVAPAGDGVHIESMTPQHLDAVFEYEDELFGREAWSRDSYAAELADRRHRHYVVALDRSGTLLGWAGVLVIAGTAQILTIGTVPFARRRGIGQRLLDTLIDEAARRGARDVVLEVRIDNEAARRMYERNRFAVLRTRRGYYDGGRVDALEMQRLLPSGGTAVPGATVRPGTTDGPGT